MTALERTRLTYVDDSTCKVSFYVPTAFTPNGDGRNDVFRPVVYGIAVEYNFIVYNRWGQKVFISNTPGEGWDGTISGTASTKWYLCMGTINHAKWGNFNEGAWDCNIDKIAVV